MIKQIFLHISVVMLSQIPQYKAEANSSVDRIYHINGRRWAKNSQSEVGCAVEKSNDFVTFSFSGDSLNVEVIYWKYSKGVKSVNNPENYIDLDTNYFNSTHYEKNEISLKSTRLKIKRELIARDLSKVKSQTISELEIDVDLTTNNPRNFLFSKVSDSSRARPPVVKGRLLCAISKPMTQNSGFRLIQPSIIQLDEQPIYGESAETSLPDVKVRHPKR